MTKDYATYYLKALARGVKRVLLNCEKHGECSHTVYWLKGKKITHCTKCFEEEKRQNVVSRQQMWEKQREQIILETLANNRLQGAVCFNQLVNYSNTNEQREVVQQIRGFADKVLKNEPVKSLLICGSTNRGKTYFARAVGRHLLEHGKKICVLDGADVLGYFQDKWHDEQKLVLQKAQIIIIDNVTPKNLESVLMFLSKFDKKKVVLVYNRSHENLKKQIKMIGGGERLLSQFQKLVCCWRAFEQEIKKKDKKAWARYIETCQNQKETV